MCVVRILTLSTFRGGCPKVFPHIFPRWPGQVHLTRATLCHLIIRVLHDIGESRVADHGERHMIGRGAPSGLRGRWYSHPGILGGSDFPGGMGAIDLSWRRRGLIRGRAVCYMDIFSVSLHYTSTFWLFVPGTKPTDSRKYVRWSGSVNICLASSGSLYTRVVFKVISHDGQGQRSPLKTCQHFQGNRPQCVRSGKITRYDANYVMMA